MKSIIKWQIGEPKEEGRYIVTLDNNEVALLFWTNSIGWWDYIDDRILAWCPLSEIEPYKE